MTSFIDSRRSVLLLIRVSCAFLLHVFISAFAIGQEMQMNDRVVLSKVLPPSNSGLEKQVKILIEFEVLPDGSIGDMKPLSKGNPNLEGVSLKALKKWKFNPIEEHIIMKGNITFTFDPDQSARYDVTKRDESGQTSKENFAIADAEERKLYSLIMQYRRQLDLPDIPLSTSLTYVANLHVQDLMQHGPDAGDCNSHSWSNKGNWSACCYTSDHAEAKCMWSKPRELTRYQGNGYEIASWSSAGIDAISALEIWKGSYHHNHVIINQGPWTKKWNAIGIGLYKNYAVVWFGREEDPEK